MSDKKKNLSYRIIFRVSEGKKVQLDSLAKEKYNTTLSELMRKMSDRFLQCQS